MSMLSLTAEIEEQLSSRVDVGRVHVLHDVFRGALVGACRDAGVSCPKMSAVGVDESEVVLGDDDDEGLIVYAFSWGDGSQLAVPCYFDVFDEGELCEEGLIFCVTDIVERIGDVVGVMSEGVFNVLDEELVRLVGVLRGVLVFCDGVEACGEVWAQLSAHVATLVGAFGKLVAAAREGVVFGEDVAGVPDEVLVAWGAFGGALRKVMLGVHFDVEMGSEAPERVPLVTLLVLGGGFADS